MLHELHITNFSIIDDATVEFGKGFNVITGETGAGKSIIINALSLSLGERAASEHVRSGEKEARIESYFEINTKKMSTHVRDAIRDAGVTIDDGLIFKRVILSQGKNRAYINSSMANVQTLSDISRNIIDIHGQYEHQSLLSNDNQLDLLDMFSGLIKDRDEVGRLYESLSSLKSRVRSIEEKDRERVQRMDILKHQINEIESAGLRQDEEEELMEEEKVLGSAGHLAELANQSHELLYASDNATLPSISTIIEHLRKISEIDSRAKDALKSAADALPLLEETSYFLRDYKDSIDFNPDRLEQVQQRLELIKALKRKYGSSIREILDYRDTSLIELEELKHSEEILDSLKSELDDVRKTFTDKARTLSRKRNAAAKKVESAVVNQLAELSMPDTQFSILLTQQSGNDTLDGWEANQTGIDNIEFLISPNVGEDLKPMAKIVSGGELSRIMLALKGIMAKGDNIPVLVFDEIDAGIGGKTAETVGKKLKALSKNHQVICITHLPQIASYADRHMKIEKEVTNKRTVVSIKQLERNDRTAEIARMLSGEISDLSLSHAKELLKRAAH
ncbi:MAG: DNA repair protein RecN [Nitrospiraceae bacterium]|nr:MAG: DNA repair protein RecN [Nitrospiraceae bacterium]